MKIELTNEEKEALELYKSGEYQVINQLLVNDSNSDISLLREDVENKSVKITYDRETLIRDLKVIKIIYELLQKIKLKRNRQEEWAFIRGTNVSEVERFKTETFIDKCLDASSNREIAEKQYAINWNEPAVMYIRGAKDIPYIAFDELENIQIPTYNDILISPFTKIKTISAGGDLKIENKVAKTYNITLENQELQGMPKEDKQNLYINILGNSDFINIKLNEVVRLEKESNNIYENIRKLEQLIAKYEQELVKKKMLANYSEYEIKVDEDNLERLKNEVNFLKTQVADIYEKIKECTEYITTWKKTITIYVMSECYDIDVKYQYMEPERNIDYSDIDEKSDIIENNTFKSNISNNINLVEEQENVIQNKDVQPEEKTKVEDNEKQGSTLENPSNSEGAKKEEIVEKTVEFKEPEYNISDGTELVNKMKEVTTSCKENSDTVDNVLKSIKYLIVKQQNYAKIAGTIGGRYSSLNNCFEMKKQAEALKELINMIYEKAEYIYNFEKNTALEKLEQILKVNLQVSTLLNYLNNPKSSVGRTKITRFEEMAIIEENELKRNIADLLIEIRGEAELKKLKEDIEIIEDKNPLQKILGIFTGKNKLDEIMIEQIIIREEAIKKTLARNLRLDYNYSIHELVAETEMFIRENEDDELVEDDVKRLKIIEDELKQNFVVIDGKIKDIINEREGRNLPIDDKVTREELIEIETYRFLKKYRYDQKENRDPEIEYQDTTANEIYRIIEYIKTSNVLS
ncbi:MAG: hypothetical protein J6J60_07180 [Clostridia bacterium]|nr:hypothetical protein [Clostridia bacterium]